MNTTFPRALFTPESSSNNVRSRRRRASHKLHVEPKQNLKEYQLEALFPPCLYCYETADRSLPSVSSF